MGPPMSAPCPFCPDNWANLDIVEYLHRSRTDDFGMLIINPLGPVTDGHVLVISEWHAQDAARDHQIGDLMRAAARYIASRGIQANIITSIGPDATQTVMHTHVHVVPRRPGDGLPLPWTPQHADAELTGYRREHYEDHMRGHRMGRSDVRCFRPYCDLRYGEREDYGCPVGTDGHGAHSYDERELTESMTCDDPIHQYANQFEESDRD